ncbi:MAG: glycosyltransferase family 39 protein [bacterium]|nr:glycosyltransferase family 39 protein [bacterium]
MTPDHRRSPFVPPADWLADVDAPHVGAPGAGFLFLMTLLAAVPRLLGVQAQSLWVDEIMTWQSVRPGAGLEFLEQIHDTIQGPLYTAVAWLLVRLGDPELMLRLPMAVAGVLTVPLFGLLAGRLVDGRSARLAVLLLAINPFHVWYSQEGRGYAFLMLFAVVAALAYLDLAAGRLRRRHITLFIASVSACVLSNLSGLFLWGAMALSMAFVDRPRQGRDRVLVTLAFGCVLLVAMPWLLQAAGIWAVDRIVPGMATGDALRGETTFAPAALPYTLLSFLYGYSLGPSLAELHRPDRLDLVRAALPLLSVAGLAAVVALAFGLGRRPDRSRARLLIWILVPTLILLALALRNVKPWNPRYVSVVLPFVLLLVARGLVSLPRAAGAITATVLLGLTVWSLGAGRSDPRYAREDVREAVRVVAAAAAPGDPVLVPVVTGVYEYYDRGRRPLIHTYGRARLAGAAEADAFCAEALAGRDRCWVVLAREWDFDPGAQLTAALGRSGSLRLVAQPAGTRIFAWERGPAAGVIHGR